MNRTDITANGAHTGGGIFLKTGDTYVGPGTTISNNQASQQAGGLGWVGSCSSGHVCQSVVDISCDARIEGNRAAVAGGGVFIGDTLNTHLTTSTECALQAVRNNSAAFGKADVFFVRGVCRPGEVSRGGWCEICLPPMYSFDANASQCHVCPLHGQCLGGAVLLSDVGYWHSTNNSTQIHACPNPAACNHSLEATNAQADLDWQCSPGYTGRVCGSCQRGYGFTTPFKCGTCMPFGKAVGLYVAALLCLIAFLCYSSHTTFKDNQQQRTAPRVSDTLKILSLYLNYIVIFSSLRVDWPRSLSVLYIASAWLLACFFNRRGPFP